METKTQPKPKSKVLKPIPHQTQNETQFRQTNVGANSNPNIPTTHSINNQIANQKYMALENSFAQTGDLKNKETAQKELDYKMALSASELSQYLSIQQGLYLAENNRNSNEFLSNTPPPIPSDSNPDNVDPNPQIRLGIGIVPLTISSNDEFFDYIDLQLFGKTTDIKWDLHGNTYKDYIGKSVHCRVNLSHLKKYLGFTDLQWEDYHNKTTQSTTDASVFRESAIKYLDKAQDRKSAVEKRDVLDTKLSNLEGLYSDYKMYKQSLVNSAMTNSMSSQSPMGTVDLSPIVLHPKWREELNEKAIQNGFKDLTDFENTINAYELAFRKETVRLADDYMQQYEHFLYLEEKRFEDKTFIKNLYQSFASSGAKEDLIKGNQKKKSAFRMMNKTGSTAIESQRLDTYQEGSSSKALGIEKVKSLDSPLFKEKAFDFDKLTTVESQGDFEKVIRDFIASQRKNVSQTRKDLENNSEAVYKLNELLPYSFQIQGVSEGSIHQKIIEDKISDMVWTDILIGIATAIGAILIVVATWGAATPIVAAGAVASLGISAYGVYEAMEDYSQANAAYEIGLLKDDPSLLWVVIAIAGAALDAGALAAVFKLSKPIAAAGKVFNETGDIATLQTKLAEIEGLSAKIQTNIIKQAELKISFQQASKDFLKASMTINSGINPAALPQLIKLARLSIQRGSTKFHQFLLELKFQKIIKDVDGLTADELKTLKEAFLKAQNSLKVNKYLPDHCDISFKQGTYYFNDLSTDELVGAVDINNGYLEFAIYRKGLSTEVRGQQVFNSLIEHLKLNNVKYKGIRGLWNASSDNTAKFNKLIMTDKKSMKDAAFGTWTGERALEQGFNKVKFDKLVPDTPPHTTVNVTFYK